MKASHKAILALAFVLAFAVPALAQTAPPTTVSTGDLAGQAIGWLVAVFGVPVGTLLAAWLYRLFALAGVQTTDLMRQRLQELIVNGLNRGASSAQERLAGKGTIAIKDEAVAQTVRYVQQHGAETLKYLGVDPTSNKAVDAIKARIETAIADAAVPTPPVLGGPAPAAVVKGA